MLIRRLLISYVRSINDDIWNWFSISVVNEKNDYESLSSIIFAAIKIEIKIFCDSITKAKNCFRLINETKNCFKSNDLLTTSAFSIARTFISFSITRIFFQAKSIRYFFAFVSWNHSTTQLNYFDKRKWNHFSNQSSRCESSRCLTHRFYR